MRPTDDQLREITKSDSDVLALTAELVRDLSRELLAARQVVEAMREWLTHGMLSARTYNALSAYDREFGE